MRYSDDLIEEIRMKNDIVDVAAKRKFLFRTLSLS